MLPTREAFFVWMERLPVGTTEEDIQYLIQIVKKDLEIRERRSFLEEAPIRITAIDKKMKEMEEDLRETRESLEKLEKERRHFEREVSDKNAKIGKKKVEQTRVKTNKEYEAISHEIDYLSKLVDKEEERILVILEQAEVKRGEVNAIAEKVDKEKDLLLADRRRLVEMMQRSGEELKIKEDEKVRILPHISDDIRRLYNRILGVKSDSGVANLVDDICQGCYSRVPPQKAHEVRRNSRIITCEVCGRILVYYPVRDKPADRNRYEKT